MAEHTSGPWIKHPSDMLAVQTTHHQNIAMIQYTQEYHPNYVSYEEAQSNARLIASAPDLLAALERLTDRVFQSDRRTQCNFCTAIADKPHENDCPVADAELAIAKAKGG